MLYQAPGPITAEDVARSLMTHTKLVDNALRSLLVAGRVVRLDGPGPVRWTSVEAPRPSAPPPDRRVPPTDAELELHRMRAEVRRLQDEVQRLHVDLARARTPMPSRDDPTEPWTEDLLVLCHPDRHDNSDRANRVTRWLLEKRRKTGGPTR